MHLSIEPQDTCALTWLKATQRINEIEGYSAHNVIMSVSQPLKESPKDTSVLELVDCFLRGNSRRMTIQTRREYDFSCKSLCTLREATVLQGIQRPYRTKIE